MKQKKNGSRPFYSLQFTMAFAFLSLILLIIGIALSMSYRFTITEVRYVSMDYLSQLIRQVNNDINQYVSYMTDVAKLVGESADVRGWMEYGSSLLPDNRSALEADVQAQINLAARSRTDITNIAVFDKNGNVIFDSPEKKLNWYAKHEEGGWFQQAIQAGGKPAISSSHVQNIVAGKYPWVVSLSKTILNRQDEPIGVLLVDLNYSLINNLCAGIDMGKRGYIFVVDKDGNIVYHPQQQLIYSHLQSENVEPVYGLNTEVTIESPDGVKLYISNHSPVTGWTVVGVAYQDEILRNQSNIIGFYITIGTTFLMAAVLLSFAISTAITGPIKRLENTMRVVQRGRLDVRSDVVSRNEVGQLSHVFNSMIARVNLLIHERDREQEQRRQSELKALHAQINPHFLYNTLDSIIWMAENENHEAVVEMTAALARLFRSSISESRETVPLSIEIAHIHSYLTIQKMRYQEKLHYNICIPPELEHYNVPKLTLQPLVENAIYHGIRSKDKGGCIQVWGEIDDERLLLYIQDDGVGMSKQQLSHLWERKKQEQHGIGVHNVHDRIRLIFGSPYGLRYTSELGKGTTVTIILPKIQEGEEEA